MQVNDTVRAVHTAGTIRRAFFATVLSVQPTLPEDIGTNGEPTLTLGFIDPTLLHLVGGIEFPKAFRRITTVRHVSHDEVQQAATEYCWTDLLPNDGGIIVIPSLNMDDLSEPAAQPAEPESTIGTIVYINHNNGLEVFHNRKGNYRVDFEGEDFDFSDLFSAQVFADAKPATEGGRIGGSPMHLVTGEQHGDNSAAVALARYEAHKAAEGWDYTGVSTPHPSAADLDAVAAENKAAEETSGAAPEALVATYDPNSGPNPATNAPAIETKEYTDGTTATGVAPLPDQSPAQQDAAEAPAQQ